LHKEFPHGNVTGSRRGFEHCGHCTSLTICRALFEAWRGGFKAVGLEVGELGVLERADRRESWVSLRGREAIEALGPARGGLFGFWEFGTVSA